MAISEVAKVAGNQEFSVKFKYDAEKISSAMNAYLWDNEANFYKVRFENNSLSSVRELQGFVPWCFNIPPDNYEVAWNQLFDTNGFYAPYGPTTAEQCHPDFSLEKCYSSNKACRWDGPSWPFATAQTLTSMANLLMDYKQNKFNEKQYFDLLKIYAQSHQRISSTGKILPWIDESINPHTGEWITRKRFEEDNFKGWGPGGVLKEPERGKDYNHSTFADLVINGLIGFRPQPDGSVKVVPLIPDTWDWFCLDRIKYHGKDLSIICDKQGTKYKRGKGLTIIYDGEKIYNSLKLKRTHINLTST